MVTIEITLLIITFVIIMNTLTAQKKLVEAQEQRFEITRVADRLRQSSDELTKFARAYVVSGDPRFKEDFYKVLAIRNGDVPRPDNYEAIYWDYKEPLRTALHPEGEIKSLEALILEQPFTEEERDKIKESHEAY